MSTSEMRPVVMFGPMLRNSIPLNDSALIPSVPAGACAPRAAQQMIAMTPYENVLSMGRILFQSTDSNPRRDGGGVGGCLPRGRSHAQPDPCLEAQRPRRSRV